MLWTTKQCLQRMRTHMEDLQDPTLSPRLCGEKLVAKQCLKHSYVYVLRKIPIQVCVCARVSVRVYVCEIEQLSAPSTPFAQSHPHSKWERGLSVQQHTKVVYERWSVTQERFAWPVGALLWRTEGHHPPLPDKDAGMGLPGLDLELVANEASWPRSRRGRRAGDGMDGHSHSLAELKDPQMGTARKYFASSSGLGCQGSANSNPVVLQAIAYIHTLQAQGTKNDLQMGRFREGHRGHTVLY